MSTFMLDLVNGNDAQDGTTWAKAWKTFLGGPTAARIAAGDTIRIAKTAAPISYAQNAQWTNGSKTVTLTTAKTANICDCEAAWTASANITQADETYYFKEGTKSRKITPAALFATGKMAYFATGTLNLSAYDKVSFWIYSDVDIAANTLKLSLCSDVAGVTSVHDTTIAFTMKAYRWYPIVSATAALPASVKSVALYALLDPGTPNIRLDNILACTTLTLQTMIGKNSAGDTFWPIQSINGTTIKIGKPSDMGANGLVYRGSTQNVSLYYRPTVILPYASAYNTIMNAPNKSGALGSLITFSGGWNTATGLRDGETVIDALIGSGIIMSMDAIDYNSFWYISFVRGTIGVCATDNSTANNILFGGASFNENAGVDVISTNPVANDSDSWIVAYGDYYGNSNYGIHNTSGRSWDVESNITVANTYGISIDKGHYSIVKTITAFSNDTYGVYLASSYGLTVEAITAEYNRNRGIYIYNCPNLYGKTFAANNNAYDGVYVTTSSSMIVEGLDVRTNGAYGAKFTSSINVKITTFNSTGNSSGPLYFAQCQIYINGSVIAEATKIVCDAYSYYGRDDFVSIKKYENTAGDHRIFLYAGTILSESTIRHTASGLAWNMTPNNALEKLRLLPNNFKVVCIANKEVTINAYVRKNAAYNGNAARLVLKGKVLTGISSDVVDTHAAAVDDWELLEVKGTPTEAGVLECFVDCDGTAGNIFVDDFAVAQAA